MDTSPEDTSGSKPSKPEVTGKVTPRAQFLPSKKETSSDKQGGAEEEPTKGNRLQEILSSRKTGAKPKHVFAENVPPGAPPASAPPPELSGEEKQWIATMETSVAKFFGFLAGKSASYQWLAPKLQGCRQWLIEKRGIRRMLEHRIITQFLPPADTEWTWKKFLLTRGFERICVALLLIFVSFGFYTCGSRDSDQKRHAALIVPGGGTNFEENIDTFQEFLALRNQGKFVMAYDRLLLLQHRASNIGGIDRHLGETSVLMGDPKRAQNNLEDALAKNESASDAHAIIGTMAYSIPQSMVSIVPPAKLAENHFQKAVEKDPANPTAYILWGIYLQNKGEYDKALKRFEQSIRAEGNRTIEKLRDISITLCRYKLKQPPGSEPNTAAFYFVQALRNFDNGTPEQAVENLIKARELVPPALFNAAVTNPLFVDYMNDPKIKPLLDKIDFPSPGASATQ